MRDFNEQHVATHDYKLILRLMKYLKPYIGQFAFAFFLMILTTFVNMVLPLASGYAIDLMDNPAYQLNEKVTIILVGAGIMVAITGVAICLSYILSKILQDIGQ